MIGHASSREEAVMQLALASKAQDPITEWELTPEEYHCLMAAPTALAYLTFHPQTLLGPAVYNKQICSKNLNS